MASSRKKQDEKNLKLLRDLASLPQNKYCFDCNQRGPTYVNVTIGSFVCTKCSGLLRGLTPPHRVKSISMASFTQGEMDVLRMTGNKYCRSTWLGLYEGDTLTNRDEQMTRDFMVEKYELKRYYMDAPLPTVTITNGFETTPQPVVSKPQEPKYKTHVSLPPINGLISDKNNKNVNGFDFVADFGSADIYNAVSVEKDKKNNNTGDIQMAFANFDNNTAFSSNGALTFNRSTNNTQFNQNGPFPPAEDRYAALKDLDNAFKNQSQLDWSSGSNNSPSVTPSSVYSSPSPQSTMFNSPSQDLFVSQFTQSDTSKVFNPFNGNVTWGESLEQSNSCNSNPFRTTNVKANTSDFFTSAFPSSNGSGWSNPFTTGSSTANEFSSNPFL